MFPTSRTINAHPHTTRPQIPSIIRTRSQQHHPLARVDLSASPLKEAIRSHNHNNNNHTFLASRTTFQEGSDDMTSHRLDSPNDDGEDEILLSPAHRKRTSSPSFSASGHAGKRVRILGQSTNTNAVSRRHSEESLSTPRKESADSQANATPSLKRAVSSGSPVKGIVHLDLTKVPQSPSKPSVSPRKTFHITIDGGRTVNVPVTPRKTSSGEDGVESLLSRAFPKITTPSEFRVHLDDLASVHGPQRFSPAERLSVKSGEDKFDGYLLGGVARRHDVTATSSRSSDAFQLRSTPIRPQLLGQELLFGGSPLTPLPPTPHPTGVALSRRSVFPENTSDGAIKSGGPLFSLPPSNSLDSARPGQSSPSKSRIPVPTSISTSRLPRPSSTPSLAGVTLTGPLSPAKSPRHRHIKHKPKVTRKPKAEVRSRAPITRLAAKRGIRRTSSLGPGLRIGTASSSGIKLAPAAEPASSHNAISTTSGVDNKQSLLTPSRFPTKNSVLSKAPLVPNQPSTSTSPAKPTPLSALSTALQKLLVTPPAAPKHRPRSNTSLGFARPSHVAAPPAVSEPAQPKGNYAEGGMKASQPTRPQTSVGYSRPVGPPNGLGRMGLPVRQPGLSAGSGGPAPAPAALYASKRTSLSTVPASPARSMVGPSERGVSPMPHNLQTAVVDVDAWAPPAPVDNGKGKAKDDTSNVDYTVPLADETHAMRKPPPESISPSRRASQASHSLSQSLSLPRTAPTARSGIVRSASTSSTAPYNPRTPVKTRGRTRPPPPVPDTSEIAKKNGMMSGKRSNARMPGSLDVLKDCVIYVDVRTEEGEDAGALFIDMLRGLGARILAKPGKSCTHLVYKDGSPLTITKYKLLPEPRPRPVSIGWVVECVEKREHVDETRFLVNLNEIGVSGGAQRRRSMQPKIMRTVTLGQLDSGQSADISVRADSSFTSEEPSTSASILAALSPPARIPNDNLPPLERARQRSFNLSRG